MTSELGTTYDINGKQVTVTRTAYNYANCLATAAYKVSSTAELNPSDLSELRNQGAFMGGQETGKCDLCKVTKEGSRFVYTATSLCDSSD